MTVCVDASVAAKWIFEEERSRQAHAVLAHWLTAGESICIPPLLKIELTNIIRKRMVRAGVTLAEAMGLLFDFQALPLVHVDAPGLHEQALEIADRYRLPAAYDAHYIGLALALECDLWTDDLRLIRAVGGNGSPLRWVGDYPV